MKLIDIQKRLSAFDDVEFSGPNTREAVDSASQKLGLPFPPEYRVFLEAYGSGSVASESFIGIGGPRHLDVVWLRQTLMDKKGVSAFPAHFLPVRSDGFGNYDCIDTHQPTSNGELAIVEWLHDGGMDQKHRVLAPNYFDWLILILDMI